MKQTAFITAAVLAVCLFSSCGNNETDRSGENSALEAGSSYNAGQNAGGAYTLDTKITDVINDPVFKDYGRLIFPVDSGYYSGDTIKDVQLTWYNNIDPNKTLEILNYMKSHAEAGDTMYNATGGMVWTPS